MENHQELASLLGDYPLALVQAVFYIKSVNGVRLREYIDLYKSQRNNLWVKEVKLLQGEDSMVATDGYKDTLSNSLGMAIQNVRNESPLAFEILGLIAYLDHNNIPLEVLSSYVNNKLELNEALSLLLKHGLVDFKGDYEGQKLYCTHEMVQLVTKDLLSGKEKERYVSVIAGTYSSIMPKQIDNTILLLNKREYLLYNIQKILEEADSLGIANEDILTLWVRNAEYYLDGKRDYRKADGLLKRVSALKDVVKDCSAVISARVLLMQSAFITWNDRDFSKAIGLAKEALSLLRNVPNAEEEYLMVYNRLTQSYYAINELDKALYYSDKGRNYVEKYKGVLGNKDAYYYARARIFIEYGKLEEALELVDKGIEALQEISVAENFTSTLPLNLLRAELLLKLDRYEEAYNLAYSLFKQSEEFFQEKPHQFTAAISTVLADIEAQRGHIEIAQSYVKKSIDTFSKLYPDKRSKYSAKSYRVLGDVYFIKGQYKEAYEQYVIAERILNEMLHNKKSEDMSLLYMKLAQSSAKLGYDVSAYHYLNLHKEIFGGHHSRTLSIISYLESEGLSL